jgi:serine/threonine protein kinase
MSDPPKDAKGIFLAALDIADAAERAAFVARSCGDDAPLRQRVEDLLRAYGQSGGPLDKLAAAMASTNIAEPIQEQAGATIGPYKLMEQIGEGGFGLVFVAEQQQPIRRKVALKIIKPGMDTRDVIARFEAERQALALMDHPNIARVLDAGTTQSGHPYFVMELVRGVPITEYCDKHQLTPRERLELFVPVCNAIQHAHLKGIIHRDIKPSNVLVTLHDGKPVVKVIDFGVAKALHQALTEHTVYTRFAQMIGTPLYMSPEQAEMSGLDIDTRTDVYSLGVVLYELLTGETPFDKRRFAKAAYDELLKIIREEEPPKPSLRLSQSSDSLPSIAALRKTEPARLSKMFSGELDWIVMKCLEKDRSRRYETANGLARDLEHYLHDEVVEAQPPTAAYRLRKFVRKHRASLTTAATIMLLLVAGAAVSTWQAVRATRAEAEMEKASMERFHALGVAETAKQIAEDRLAEAEAERKRAETERDRAERQLANGLLRPIGFSTQGIDPAELRSFVDWSAIKESRPKMRVLEIALDNPETALRVARRAERVIQSCVGLSSTRRAKAIQIVSAKQRDTAADPRVRVAACWLAMELGSDDLPAWVESCKYLSEPKNNSSDRFPEFVDFAVRRSDLRQIAHLDPDPLIAILESSTNDRVQWSLCVGFKVLAPRLEPIQIERVGSALISVLEKSTDSNLFRGASSGLQALAPRLEAAQVKRAADAVIATLGKATDASMVRDAYSDLTALAPRLQPAQVNRAWDALIARLEKSATHLPSDEEESYLSALVLRLEPAQVARAADALIQILGKSTDENVLSAQAIELTALAPRLRPAQAKRGWDALVAMMRNSTDDEVLYVESMALTALAPRLESAQLTPAANALIAMMDKSTNYQLIYRLSDGLAALAPRLELALIKRVGDALIAMLEKSTDIVRRSAAVCGVSALAPRLESAHLTRAAAALIGTLEKSGGSEPYGECMGLRALAPRLEPAQAKRAGDALVARLKKSTNDNVLYVEIMALTALARRLEPAQAKRGWDALNGILEKRPFVSAGDGLTALAPRLEPAEVKRAADALIRMLQRPKDASAGSTAVDALVALAPRLESAEAARAWDALIAAPGWAGLVALTPRLEPASRDNRSTTATAVVLDYLSSDGPNTGAEVGHLVVLARSISSPRSLANLLSHPTCVAKQREVLLKRFEELVFHDGKPVFLKSVETDGEKPAGDPSAAREFHNLHDAAAWIQKNWPDFDLEATCPVTWRGSR